MKKMCLCACMLISLHAFAQNSIVKKTTLPQIKPALEVVVRDYLQHFSESKGDTISRLTGQIDFTSKIEIPGSIRCVIREYITPRSFSWEALMLRTEDFAEAAASYKQYFNQLKGQKISTSKVTHYALDGEYDAPSERRSFASSRLELLGAAPGPARMYIEIGLNYLFPEWEVSIMVYDKIPDDEIRPQSNYSRGY